MKKTDDKGKTYGQRKIPYLKVVEPPENPKQLKKAERKVRWKKWEGAVSILILAVLAICGTYLLLDNKTYGTAREAASYTKEISDTSNYVQFAKGIIRYNRNGVVYLNKKNEEVWIQPTQIKTPMIEVRRMHLPWQTEAEIVLWYSRKTD